MNENGIDECQKLQKKVEELQKMLQEAEQNTILAATYGKQILQEKTELCKKVESLEQEKHRITLKLEAKLKIETSLSVELEQLQEQQKQQVETLTASASQKYNKKVLDLESIIGNLRLELQQSEEKCELIENQLKESQERMDECSTSILDQTTDETAAAMQSQIMSLTSEKQEFELLISSLKSEVKLNKQRFTQVQDKLTEVENELEEKECQCTAYYNALEKNKEEIVELQLELDNLRLAQTDPNRKGNSLFAEVEDQRVAMEKQLANYKTNYNILKKQCDLKSQQVTKLKLQVASLLSLSNNRADGEYLKHLEVSLSSARAQLEIFTKRCQELENTRLPTTVKVKTDDEDEEGTVNQLFKNLYTESQKKVAALDEELRTAQFDKVVLSDRILQLQRKLHQTEMARDSISAQAIRLQVKLEDLATKTGEKLRSDVKEVKVVKEKIPGFETNPPAKIVSDRTPLESSQPLKEKHVDANTGLETNPPTTPTTMPDRTHLKTSQPLKEKYINVNTEFETNSPTETVPDRTSVESSQPLKEKPVEANTLQTDMKSHRKDDIADVAKASTSTSTKEDRITYACEEEVENKEPTTLGLKKKIKKFVQLGEVVTVQESDGQVQKAEVKTEDGLKKAERKRKVLKKVEAPIVTVDSSEATDCKMQ